MITIYGRIYSRTPRVLWAAEEMALDYRHISVNHKTGDTSKPEYLAINPNGKIPALVDGDVKLFESMAINFYLAEKYGKSLWLADVDDRARALQWSFWGVSEIDPLIIVLILEYVRKSREAFNQAAVDEARAALERMFGVLERALSERPYLLGSEFTIADLNLASIIALYTFVGTPVADLLDAFPLTHVWLHGRCLARPAYRKVMAMEPPPADLPHLQPA